MDSTTFIDHYATLQVSWDAEPSAIRANYKKLAMIHHPDKNIYDQSATARFQMIEAAYSILSNQDKRNTYDKMYSMFKARAHQESNTFPFTSNPGTQPNAGGRGTDQGSKFSGRNQQEANEEEKQKARQAREEQQRQWREEENHRKAEERLRKAQAEEEEQRKVEHCWKEAMRKTREEETRRKREEENRRDAEERLRKAQAEEAQLKARNETQPKPRVVQELLRKAAEKEFRNRQPGDQQTVEDLLLQLVADFDDTARKQRTPETHKTCSGGGGRHRDWWLKMIADGDVCGKCGVIDKPVFFRCPGCGALACARCRDQLRKQWNYAG